MRSRLESIAEFIIDRHIRCEQPGIIAAGYELPTAVVIALIIGYEHAPSTVLARYQHERAQAAEQRREQARAEALANRYLRGIAAMP